MIWTGYRERWTKKEIFLSWCDGPQANLSQLGLAGIGKEGAHLHERVVQRLTHPGRVCWAHMPQPARGRTIGSDPRGEQPNNRF